MPTISDSLTKSILEAAGLSSLSGAEADYAIERILDDHLCLELGAKLAARAFVVDAVRNMAFVQLETLRKRIRPAQRPRVQWAVGQTERTEQVEHFISARVPSEEVFFTGTPEAAHTFRFQGELCPPEIVAQYITAKTARYIDPESVAETRRLERERLDAATKRQNQSTGI